MPRWVTTLGVSFDHRLADGEQGSTFLVDIAVLADPGLALLYEAGQPFERLRAPLAAVR